MVGSSDQMMDCCSAGGRRLSGLRATGPASSNGSGPTCSRGRSNTTSWQNNVIYWLGRLFPRAGLPLVRGAQARRVRCARAHRARASRRTRSSTTARLRREPVRATPARSRCRRGERADAGGRGACRMLHRAPIARRQGIGEECAGAHARLPQHGGESVRVVRTVDVLSEHSAVGDCALALGEEEFRGHEPSAGKTRSRSRRQVFPQARRRARVPPAPATRARSDAAASQQRARPWSSSTRSISGASGRPMWFLVNLKTKRLRKALIDIDGTLNTHLDRDNHTHRESRHQGDTPRKSRHGGDHRGRLRRRAA